MLRKPLRLVRSLLAVLLALILVLLVSPRTGRAEESTPTAEITEPRFTAADVIETVNNLRTSHGMAALSIHPVLMQVAQIEANGIAAGYGGHWRPNNLSLGQWLLSLGYPLSGDLSMDGYRSENWFSLDISSELSEVTQFWQGDPEHSDTMFSPDRSDIGAALAVGEDGQVFVVLETALQTASGKMQYDAYAILTGIPATQAAYAGMATQAAANGVPLQYSIPVALSTARPDGAVYHEVKYGQSLWSIAIAYHTTIQQLQSLNRLSTNMVYEGQKLLVMNGATQPAPQAAATLTPAPLEAAWMPSPLAPVAATVGPAEAASPPNRKADALSLGAIVVVGLFLAGVLTAAFRKRPGA